MLKNLIDSVSSNSKTVVDVDSFELIPFVLSPFRFPVVLLVDSFLFDDVFSSFPFDGPFVVGVPFQKKASLDDNNYIYSYHGQLFRSSYFSISSNFKSIDVFVVDQNVFDKKVFHKNVSGGLDLSKKNLSYGAVLSFFSNNGYNKKEMVGGEGDFVLRGGVVDVYPYGEKQPFRLSFLNDFCVLVYSFDIHSKEVLEKVVNPFLSPYFSGESESLKEKFNNKCVLVFFENNKLVFNNTSILDSSVCFFKNGFKKITYYDYKGLSRPPSFLLNKALVGCGCFYDGRAFLPFWFKNTKKPAEESVLISPSANMVVGDFFVHEQFGVCKYLGLEDQSQLKEDRVCLKFLDGILRLDVSLLYCLSFYSSDKQVVLDSLNKKARWRGKKLRAFSAAKQYVDTLAVSYLNRNASVSSPYVFDEDLFNLFISLFPYKDTAGQASAWKDVLSDLLSKKPMNRLLCGDVGFGKTEIAMRSLFVAATNKKKSFLVAPTTILVKQLFGCCVERLGAFNIVVKEVSRSSKKNSLVFSDFLSGKIDVLVGTHSLIRRSDVLSGVDLFIIDEEHRFGVADKERIFTTNPGANFLAMSATPIPRSLQLSLSGVRDISFMLSPPQLRKPVGVNICTSNVPFVKSVLLSSFSNKKQVFVVDNSVKGLVVLYNKFSRLLEGVVCGILYGSMSRPTVDKTMGLFRNKKIDILFTTTIIESGIDVPLANTIVVFNSHLFGLSQLYQLKGRVGRSSSQSFAYFLLPKKGSVSSSGLRRLKSIQTYTALGSGYKIALSDLNIRGSGSLFGFSQSGLSLVGFEYYSKLVGDVLSNSSLKSKIINPALFPRVSLGKQIIPDKYILNDLDRVSFYKSFAETFDLKFVKKHFLSVVRVFGPPPKHFVNFYNAKIISLLLYDCGVSQVYLCEKFIVFDYVVFQKKDFSHLVYKVGLFFKKRNSLFSFKEVGDVLKFQFNHNNKDVYILCIKLIKYLYG